MNSLVRFSPYAPGGTNDDVVHICCMQSQEKNTQWLTRAWSRTHTFCGDQTPDIMSKGWTFWCFRSTAKNVHTHVLVPKLRWHTSPSIPYSQARTRCRGSSTSCVCCSKTRQQSSHVLPEWLPGSPKGWKQSMGLQKLTKHQNVGTSEAVSLDSR